MGKKLTSRAMSDTSHVLAALRQGQPSAPEQLWPLVYDELRKFAAAKLAHEKPGQTLQATALVHEAWLRLVGQEKSGVGDQTSVGKNPTSDLRLPTSALWQSRSH